MRKQLKQQIFLLFFLGIIFNVVAQEVVGQANIKTVPTFRDGEAQMMQGFSSRKEWIKHELWVETTFDSDKDGKLDRMHVFVTRPYQTDTENLKLPVIYTSSPYFGIKLFSVMFNNSKKYMWDVKHELGATPKPHKHTYIKRKDAHTLMLTLMEMTWVPRGYIMVYSSSPGTGLSEGVPTIGGKNESLAPKAVIDWLCGRADAFKTKDGNEIINAYWCNGKVGMTGTSYEGTLALAAATTGVDGLEAIIPIAPNTSYYHYYRSNGLVRSPGGYLGEDVDVLFDFINSGDKAKRDRNSTIIRDKILVENQDRISGDYNEFWASRDYLSKMKNMKAAMLMSHGFNDWNVMPEHSYRIYKEAKALGIPTQLYYHQGGHGGEPPTYMMNRWFTRYLHGVENDVENDPKVRIVRERDYYSTPYRDYPDPNSSDITLYLESGNPERGYLSTTMLSNQKNETLIDDYSKEGKKLAKAKKSDHRLLYVTPILEQDIRLSGVAKVTIKLACNKSAANLSVWLVSLPWKSGFGTEIYDNIITRGWADPQNHSSLTKGEDLEPGKFYTVSFDLMPDDQVIPKGQQIGLMIFSSDKEFTLWPEPGTELTINLDSTSITLPIVGGKEKFEKAIKNNIFTTEE